MTDSFRSLKPVLDCNPRAIPKFWKFFLNICIYHAEYLRSWDLCLLCWISQNLSFVYSMEYLRYWDLCLMFEYLRSWDLCLPYWISQVLKSVSFVLIISVLKICVTPNENLRSWGLCQLWRISQSFKSVSDV